MSQCEEIKECIACGNTNLEPLLDLGSQPLANSFLKHENEPENLYPLATNYCKDCFHVQLTHKVNPDLLFKNYLYVSGTAKTQLEYFEWFAKFVYERCGNFRSVKVLDIGCNDGSQLDELKSYGAHTFGIDPAENLHKLSSKNHVVHCAYFDGTQFAPNEFAAVICQNAFAHNYNQLEFLSNMKKVVDPEGYIYITTSQADMILNCEFDTIYHEHLSFYNIKSMNELCKRAGLYIHEVVKHPIHGTSFIFVLTKNSAKNRSAYVELLIEAEKRMDLYNPELYQNYVEECKYIIESFAETVKQMKSQYKIIGYGAPAKGNTLLNAAKVKLDFIVDDNPLKQGTFTPGMHIPVYGSDKLKEYENDDVVFVPLAWNFFDEIKKKITEMRPNRLDMFLKTYPLVYLESANE
jgi:SAM-dependent methyltransferase